MSAECDPLADPQHPFNSFLASEALPQAKQNDAGTALTAVKQPCFVCQVPHVTFTIPAVKQ